MLIKLNKVRLGFASLFAAKAFNGEGEPKFSAVFIIEPKSAQAKLLHDVMETVALDKWKDKAKNILHARDGLVAKDKVCYREYALAKDGEVYAGFENTYCISSSNKVRPLVIDRDKTPLTEQDGRPYPGCIVNVSLDMWAQDNAFGKRINCTLKGVQFVADGDALGGSSPASVNDFETIEDDADALV